jgi:hypothetical protein
MRNEVMCCIEPRLKGERSVYFIHGLRRCLIQMWLYLQSEQLHVHVSVFTLGNLKVYLFK